MSYMIIVYKSWTLGFRNLVIFQHSKFFLCTPPYGLNSVLNFVYPTLWLPMITYANQYMWLYDGEIVFISEALA